MKLYALRFKETGKYVGFKIVSNEGAEFSVSATIELEEFDPIYPVVWTTSNPRLAEKVANTTTEWYNAGYLTPVNHFVGQLEVVEFNSMG